MTGNAPGERPRGQSLQVTEKRYSPLRNKLPRTPGQGTSRRRKVVTGISGSQTGPSGGQFVRLGIPELVQSGGAISGQSSAVNWPLNLPGTGNQDAVDLTVPYRFWGLSENLSWLAQFSGGPGGLAALRSDPQVQTAP
jgi:hypothetical protein